MNTTAASAAGRARSRLLEAFEGALGGALTWLSICVWTAGWGWNRLPLSGVSWHFFVDGTAALFGGSGLHLYADHPDLQIGPLAFGVLEVLGPLPSGAQKAAAQLLMTAVAPLLLWLLAPLVPGDLPVRRLRLMLAGLVLAPVWTVLSVRWMHLEDVLALLLSVLAVRLVGLGRRDGGPDWAGPAAGLALGAAMTAKPWAIGFVPVLLALPLWSLVSGLVVAGVATLAGWGPFLLADGRTLDALRPPVGVSDSSGLWTLGYHGAVVPSWGRTAQLVGAPLAGLLAALRRRWPGVLLAAIAVRLALDPQDIAYYAAGAVVAALVFDLLLSRRTIPWTALVTAVVLWQPFSEDFAHRFTSEHGLNLWWFQHPGVVGTVHLIWSAAMVLLVVAAPARWLGTDASR
ncbi:MAG TPA: hypothetical protein VFP72_24280 [Kineosporiaceae bacterium]|nr:hypothetical protein [Kineosporiaceae bacterium]